MFQVSLAILTFAALVFYAEKDTDNEEDAWTFVDSLWWGIMTLTTVGYDHKSPKTALGKLTTPLQGGKGFFYAIIDWIVLF